MSGEARTKQDKCQAPPSGWHGASGEEMRRIASSSKMSSPPPKSPKSPGLKSSPSKYNSLLFLKGFMSLWDTQNKDGIVTRSEFTQYYSDISAAIDDDDYFANMIGAAWGL